MAARACLLAALGREVRYQAGFLTKTNIPVAALAPGLCTARWLDASRRVLMSRKVARQEKFRWNGGALLVRA